MPKFTAKERNPGEPCFVYDEDNEMIFNLKPPADLGQAQDVARYLNAQIESVEADPDSLPILDGMG